MEIQDDFIVGIFNYCDRWCERCRFTSRCRVFADLSEFEFERDHGPLTEPMRDRFAKSLGAMATELDLALDDIEKTAQEFERPEIAPEHRAIDHRARDHGEGAFRLIRKLSRPADPVAADAFDVIAHDSFLLGVKIHRALLGMAEGDEGQQSDANGSAKLALIVMDRLRPAWAVLAAATPGLNAEPFIAELAWLTAQLNQVLPYARHFVRPGFDEPVEVARLESGSW